MSQVIVPRFSVIYATISALIYGLAREEGPSPLSAPANLLRCLTVYSICLASLMLSGLRGQIGNVNQI